MNYLSVLQEIIKSCQAVAKVVKDKPQAMMPATVYCNDVGFLLGVITRQHEYIAKLKGGKDEIHNQSNP